MAMLLRFLLLLVCSAALPLAHAADPVDLRGKKGVVDPQDLKKHDPPERSLKTKEPPAPKTKEENKDTGRSSPPSDQGNDPGRGSSAVPKQVPKYAPPRPAPRPVR